MDLNINTNDLSQLDPATNLPIQSNFEYYSTQGFRDSHQIQNCTSGKYVSVLYSNIRSLNANFDNFIQLLSEPDRSDI